MNLYQLADKLAVLAETLARETQDPVDVDRAQQARATAERVLSILTTKGNTR